VTEQEVKKARGYLLGFQASERLLEGQGHTVYPSVWKPIVDEINRAHMDFPEVVRAFQVEDFTVGEWKSGPMLTAPGLRGYLGLATARLQVEIEGGARRFTSEVLADFVGLAREILAEPGDNPKNVAAVLAAAAYEDTLRRMAGGPGPEKKLATVIDDLKAAGILVAPQLQIALSFLSFRNHALHAQWETIERGSVDSVLGFVQDLLLKHF
jgi:hypothetical protein